MRFAASYSHGILNFLKLHSMSTSDYTLGGRALPAFSQPIVSTGAPSEDLIMRIPLRTFSQLAGGSPVIHLTLSKDSFET